jgi:hypothetical protein
MTDLARAQSLADEAKELIARYGKQTGEFLDGMGRIIRDAKELYGKTKEYSEWIRTNLEYSVNYAAKIRSSWEMRERLRNTEGVKKLPETEAICRELSSLPTAKQKSVWLSVQGNKEPVIAKKVKLLVAKMSPKPPKTTERVEAPEEKPEVVVIEPRDVVDPNPFIAFTKVVEAAMEAVKRAGHGEVAEVWLQETYGLVHEAPKPSKKPAGYLPSLPDEHEKAVKIVRAEITERHSQLKTNYSGWDNGKAGYGRSYIKHLTTKATDFKKSTGIDSAPAAAELFDTTWPEHLDTDQVKQGWELYKADRKASGQNMGSDILQDRISELSRFEEEVVIQVLKDSRNGRKGTWAGFNHNGMDRYKKTRNKDGMILKGSVSENIFGEVRQFCQGLHLSQPYYTDIKEKFGDPVARVVKSCSLKKMQEGGAAVAEKFKLAMEGVA